MYPHNACPRVVLKEPHPNAIAERFILTMKVEVIWAQDWESAEELRQALDAWRLLYNHERPHESLAWETPVQRREKNLVAAKKAAA